MKLFHSHTHKFVDNLWRGRTKLWRDTFLWALHFLKWRKDLCRDFVIFLRTDDQTYQLSFKIQMFWFVSDMRIRGNILLPQHDVDVVFDGQITKLTHCLFKYRCLCPLVFLPQHDVVVVFDGQMTKLSFRIQMFCFASDVRIWGNEGNHRSDKIARRLSCLASFKSERESGKKRRWKVTFPDNILKGIGDCLEFIEWNQLYCHAAFHN